MVEAEEEWDKDQDKGVEDMVEMVFPLEEIAEAPRYNSKAMVLPHRSPWIQDQILGKGEKEICQGVMDEVVHNKATQALKLPSLRNNGQALVAVKEGPRLHSPRNSDQAHAVVNEDLLLLSPRNSDPVRVAVKEDLLHHLRRIKDPAREMVTTDLLHKSRDRVHEIMRGGQHHSLLRIKDLVRATVGECPLEAIVEVLRKATDLLLLLATPGQTQDKAEEVEVHPIQVEVVLVLDQIVALEARHSNNRCSIHRSKEVLPSSKAGTVLTDDNVVFGQLNREDHCVIYVCLLFKKRRDLNVLTTMHEMMKQHEGTHLMEIIGILRSEVDHRLDWRRGQSAF